MNNNSKKIKVAIVIFAILLVAVLLVYLFLNAKKVNENNSIPAEQNTAKQQENNKVKNNVNNTIDNDNDDDENTDVAVVPTMNDEILEDSVWCPTFQLVWNDMKNEVVKKDVEFIDGGEPEYLDNLNAELFTTEDISDALYYKNWGEKSNKLKEEILDGIKEKFNETSDVIDESENWDREDGENKKYVFYTMLKKEFNFLKEFDILEKGKFGKKYNNVEYFGIDEESENELRKQVTVLYYDNEDNFAFSVNTKENDEVIFVKKPEEKTFEEVYKKMKEKAENYEGKKDMQIFDNLKIPNLNLDILKEYEELLDKKFLCADNDTAVIEKALQTVKLKLNNKGGEIKSEAVMEIEKTSAIEPVELTDPRELYLDDEFVMFVKEKDKEQPYFALKVSDISNYQENVK